MIVLALAVLAVLVAIVILAMGMGGEMGSSHPDHPQLTLPRNRSLAGTDVALLGLPIGLIGYHTGITNEALRRVATELADRDTRIAVLEQRLAAAEQRLAARGESDSATPVVPPSRVPSRSGGAGRGDAAVRQPARTEPDALARVSAPGPHAAVDRESGTARPLRDGRREEDRDECRDEPAAVRKWGWSGSARNVRVTADQSADLDLEEETW